MTVVVQLLSCLHPDTLLDGMPWLDYQLPAELDTASAGMHCSAAIPKLRCQADLAWLPAEFGSNAAVVYSVRLQEDVLKL